MVAAATVMAVWAILPVARAQEGEAVRLDVRPGHGGYTRAYSANPIEIVVEANTRFSGEIVIATPLLSGRTSHRFPIEVAGGSRKVLRAIMPRATIQVVSAVGDDGRVAASTSGGGTPLQGGESLIGVLSLDPPPVTAARIPVTQEIAPVVGVSREIAALGGGALRSLSHLVVDGALSTALSDAEVDALHSYLVDGGELIVAARDDADLAFLPPAWRPIGDQRREVGEGAVTAAAPLRDAGWQDGGGAWARSVRPVDIMRWVDGHPSIQQSLLGAVAQSQGLRRPTLGWLLAFILGYVALAGPVNFAVLARLRRRELAWVTVPALALVFATGAYAAGGGFRTGPVRRGAAIVVVSDGGHRVEAVVGIMSPSGGVEEISVRGAQRLEPITLPYGPSGFGANGSITPGRDTLTASYRLSIGEVGTLGMRAVRPTPAGDAGRVRAGKGGFDAAVTNTSPWLLRRPVLIVGDDAEALEDLAPGTTEAVQLRSPSTHALQALVSSYLEFAESSDPSAAPGFPAPNPVPVPPPVQPPGGGRTVILHGYSPYDRQFPSDLLAAAVGTTGLGETGRAHLVGWVEMSETLAPHLGEVEGPSLVVLPLRLEGDPTALAGVTGTFVETNGQLAQYGYGTATPYLESARRLVVRFELPDGAAPGRLRLQAATGALSSGGVISYQGPGGGFITRSRAVPVPRRLGNSYTARFYDPATGTWTNPVKVATQSVTVPNGGLVGPDGAVYVRIDSPSGEPIPRGAFVLRGLA